MLRVAQAVLEFGRAEQPAAAAVVGHKEVDRRRDAIRREQPKEVDDSRRVGPRDRRLHPSVSPSVLVAHQLEVQLCVRRVLPRSLAGDLVVEVDVVIRILALDPALGQHGAVAALGPVEQVRVLGEPHAQVECVLDHAARGGRQVRLRHDRAQRGVRLPQRGLAQRGGPADRVPVTLVNLGVLHQRRDRRLALRERMICQRRHRDQAVPGLVAIPGGRTSRCGRTAHCGCTTVQRRRLMPVGRETVGRRLRRTG
mmetsp:Transcript_59776/g.163845  ORF Transcript_59776/g.163845 Transcript_59776/m.163845 type:complete len:254 (+) Transcript_59776:620-1381(+)